ncbi:MAG: hypothetical protein FJ098_14970 [Deltaproteobacteria bacterium]|nr:hypothetical protein [Deltaproteobacteria bacterium]
MRRGVIPILMLLAMSLPAQARPPLRDRGPVWQDKYLSLGAGLTGVLFHPSRGSRIRGPGDRFTGTFSLQTGIWYVMGDLRVSTDPGFDFAAGGFLRLARLGPGFLVAEPMLFARLAERRVEIPITGGTKRDPIRNGGAGLRLEYLLFRSTLSVYVEARQTFVDPLETDISLGLSWSPLMFLLERDSW